MSMLVCAMTLLCPVWCMADSSAHCDAPNKHVAGETEVVREESGHEPHHEHDPGGDPNPHGTHTCVCTGGTQPGAALRIPALQPTAIFTAVDLIIANLDKTFLPALLDAWGPKDTSFGLRCAPLLI